MFSFKIKDQAKKKKKKKKRKNNVFPSDDERTVGTTFYAREIENWYATCQT